MDKSNEEHLVAVTPFGLESVCAGEIQRMGGFGMEPRSGVVLFTGDLYAANLKVRCAMRILRPLAEFSAANPKALYARAKHIDWRSILTPSMTLAVDAHTRSDVFRSGRYVGQIIKDAAVDTIRQASGRRPSVDPRSPSVRIHASVHGTDVRISLDSSDPPLYQRGYRRQTVEAPMNECLAAGVVLMSGFEGKGAFIDPMCGSGTIAIEAALMAQNIAPGLARRRFGFFGWRDYDEARWQRTVAEARSIQIERPDATIIAADRDPKAVEATIANARVAGARVHVTESSFENLVNRLDESLLREIGAHFDRLLVMNPPYGERIAVDDEATLYRSIGDTFKRDYAGFAAWVVTGSAAGRKSIGLRHSLSVPLYNGPIECRLRRYDIH